MINLGMFECEQAWQAFKTPHPARRLSRRNARGATIRSTQASIQPHRQHAKSSTKLTTLRAVLKAAADKMGVTVTTPAARIAPQESQRTSQAPTSVTIWAAGKGGTTAVISATKAPTNRRIPQTATIINRDGYVCFI